MCMYISLWLYIFDFIIMKLFKHTEKNEDYNKNPCTYNPGFIITHDNGSVWQKSDIIRFVLQKAVLWPLKAGWE